MTFFTVVGWIKVMKFCFLNSLSCLDLDMSWAVHKLLDKHPIITERGSSFLRAEFEGFPGFGVVPSNPHSFAAWKTKIINTQETRLERGVPWVKRKNCILCYKGKAAKEARYKRGVILECREMTLISQLGFAVWCQNHVISQITSSSWRLVHDGIANGTAESERNDFYPRLRHQKTISTSATSITWSSNFSMGLFHFI